MSKKSVLVILSNELINILGKKQFDTYQFEAGLSLSPSTFFLIKRNKKNTLLVCFLLMVLGIAHLSITNSLAGFYSNEVETETFEEENREYNTKVSSLIDDSSLTIDAVDEESDSLSSTALNAGISWGNTTLLDSPLLSVTPKNTVDSNDNLHIVWTNWYDGRKLYHQILYADGNWSEKTVLVSKADGVSITADIVADTYGKVHLAYSWGAAVGTQRLYYTCWESGVWSSSERVDFGVNEYGDPIPASYPLIRVTSDGTPHIVWSGYVSIVDVTMEDFPLYYQKRLAPGVWSDVLWSGSSTPETFSFLITKDDYFYVGTSIREGDYYSRHHINIVRKGPTDNAWLTNDELVDYAILSNLRIAPNVELVEVGDTLHCFGVFLDDDDAFIFDFMSAGVLWDYAEIVTSDVAVDRKIQLSAMAINDSDILLTYNWHYRVNGTLQSSVSYKTYYDNLNEWSDTTLLPVNHTRAVLPDISLDKKGNVHLTWGDSFPDTGYVLNHCYGVFDRDLDGLSNFDEQTIYFTDPNDADSDDDLLIDGDEISLGMDPWNPDEDSDLILDGWEIAYGLDPFNATDATIDQDVDGLTNLEEFNAGTDPTMDDTDGDGLIDGAEVNTHGTDPINVDSDFDELSDGDEIITWGTDALNNDTDTDGMPDGYETQNSLDPLIDDAGGDLDVEGLTNIEEYQEGTDPNNNDTDADKITDWEEVFIGADLFITNPLSNDTDGDLLTDYYEIVIDPLDDTYLTNNIYQTSPILADNDSDLLSDFYELNVSLTNPLTNDTDSDLMIDGYEWMYGLDPFTDDADEDYDEDSLTNYIESLYFSDPYDEDTDGDELLDNEEVEYGTSLINADTDGDWLTDYYEITYFYTDPLDPDTDDDGLNDFYEKIYYLTNPFNNDTDGDTILDGYEVFILGSNPVNKDTDGDGLEDNIELSFNSSLLLTDTEGDGMDDFWEWTFGFDPQFDEGGEDADNDGLTNYEEFRFSAHPHNNDTDGDFLDDYEEVYVYLTYPFDNDTDDDMLLDYDEIAVYFTNAHDPDTDDDSLTDGEEILTYLTNPLLYDSDSDGYSDFEEISEGTDPLNAKSNPGDRQIYTTVIVFGSVIAIIMIYYLSPFLFTRAAGKRELGWITIGQKNRHEKSERILKAVEEEVGKKDKEEI